MISRDIRRKFGQNYLSDPAIIFEMGQAISPQTNSNFFEIGPGMGALTNALNQDGIFIKAIDIDQNNKTLSLKSGNDINYDKLLISVGSSYSYFGNDNWSNHSQGLKNLNDALDIRDNILKTHQIDTAKKIILFPARITSWKGQLEFIDVIKKMDTQNILVLFAGDTKNKSYTKLVRDKIERNNLKHVCKILGSVNQDEMRSLYQIADLSLSFPLRTEGFGRTVSESLYSKTPVLAFDYGGVKNQLANLSDMFKVKPQDFQVLPAKIEKLLSLSEVEKKEALEGVQSVIESNFSKINMVKQYLKLYESFKS